MARIYAGVLGPLAMLTSMAHGMLHARGTEQLLLTACAWLLVFAALGALVGGVAGWMVEESVSSMVARQVEAEKRSRNGPPAGAPLSRT